MPGTLADLIRPILRVPDTMPADRLLGFLRERRSHQALVVDAGGTVVGMITLEDVLGELLGGVPDEFKAPRLLPLRLTTAACGCPAICRSSARGSGSKVPGRPTA